MDSAAQDNEKQMTNIKGEVRRGTERGRDNPRQRCKTKIVSQPPLWHFGKEDLTRKESRETTDTDEESEQNDEKQILSDEG